jgi:uncharacterized phage protein (TIGR01671 family)
MKRREIKFRAWIQSFDDENKNEMCYDLAFEEYLPINDLLANVKHLMQYTGIKDRTGKEVYEGDICKTWSSDFQEQIQSVSFEKGSFTFSYMGWPISEYPLYGIEVIGNIYETPQLLTKK